MPIHPNIPLLIIALSDHGFADFRRAFSLNTWLLENGYAARKQSAGGGYLEAFDWGRTQAYGLGFSGLYLNLRGRERGGTVAAAEKDALLNQLSAELVQIRDPLDGVQVITRVLRGDRIYSGALARNAPDLVMCYNRGYRASWETVVGLFSGQVIADNTDQWSGDHLMDPELVPGVFFTNRPINTSHPSLLDLAPTILKEFGVDKMGEMKGRPIF
jgi:predicted AlkP superfamily phosphohydrolase/phosphomutase